MKEELRAFIVDNYLFGQSIEFGDRDSFTETGIIDSTGVLELVAFLEERYGIVVGDEDLLPDNLDSIDKLTDFLGRKGVKDEVKAPEGLIVQPSAPPTAGLRPVGPL